MNVPVLTVEVQAAEEDGVPIVSRKIWICQAQATAEDPFSAPTVDLNSKVRKVYVHSEDVWPDAERLEAENAMGVKPSFELSVLRKVAAVNQLTTLEQLQQHFDNPPRIY